MRAKEGGVRVRVCMEGGKKNREGEVRRFVPRWIFDGVKVAGYPRHDRLNYWLISMAFGKKKRGGERVERRVELFSIRERSEEERGSRVVSSFLAPGVEIRFRVLFIRCFAQSFNISFRSR